MPNGSAPSRSPLAEPGAWLMLIGSAGSLIASLIYYFWRGDGIAYTVGAGIVIGASAVMLIATLVMAIAVRRPWGLSAFLNIGTCVGVLGTGFAAWMLEANWVLGLMCLVGLGWLIHVILDPRAEPVAPSNQPHLQESAR
jgi:hypothetical protein